MQSHLILMKQQMNENKSQKYIRQKYQIIINSRALPNTFKIWVFYIYFSTLNSFKLLWIRIITVCISNKNAFGKKKIIILLWILDQSKKSTENPIFFTQYLTNSLFIELVVQTPFIIMVEGERGLLENGLHNNWWSINRNENGFYLHHFNVHAYVMFEWLDWIYSVWCPLFVFWFIHIFQQVTPFEQCAYYYYYFIKNIMLFWFFVCRICFSSSFGLFLCMCTISSRSLCLMLLFDRNYRGSLFFFQRKIQK